MDKTDTNNSESNCGNLVPFDEWLRSIGKRRVTGWNWRKRGTVKATNIFGRLYITRSEIARFEARAVDGEFVVQRRVASTKRQQDRKSVGFIERLICRKSKTTKGSQK
jgi:predicted site-specific integrase-resolvase